MPRNDFACPSCGKVEEHTYPVVECAKRPICLSCFHLMEWLPPHVRMDAYEPFQEFTVHHGGRPVLVDSLSKLRAVERESEVMARNGEGQPLVWRAYSQDRSNNDVHTLATHGVDQPVGGWDGIKPDPSRFRTSAQAPAPASIE